MMDGGAEKERELHERFAHLRIKGEWFWPGEELLHFIRESASAA